MITMLLIGVVIGIVAGYIPTRTLTEWRIARHGAGQQWGRRKAYRE